MYKICFVEKKSSNIELTTFKNFISLGFFCSIATDLAKLGLRHASYPFDWTLSNFRSVISLIENHFDGFLNYENLSQDKDEPSYYYDCENKIWFYHDFSAYKPLKEQLSKVQEKYLRRISRFYKTISEPTLFIRYIDSESDEEFLYIKKNYSSIIKVLKFFNPKNEIIFITHKKQYILPNCYYVEKPKDDSVNRNPLFADNELFMYFSNVDNPRIYKRKNAKTLILKIKKLILKLFKKPYRHNKIK